VKESRIKSLIISPSGNLYGSERVLLDYLKNTNRRYFVFVPSGGALKSQISKLSRHKMLQFNDRKLSYFYIYLILFVFFRRIRSIYVNEGGHVRYIRILATLFPGRKFFLHLRIVEDISKERLAKIPENLSLVTISDYMQNLLIRNGYTGIMVNDTYPFKETSKSFANTELHPSVSVIGRFTVTKGSKNVLQFFQYLSDNSRTPFTLNIFGNVDNSAETQSIVSDLRSLKGTDVVFHGFIDDPDVIYSQSRMIIHFNQHEPLGRIFFEAIDYQIPFIGFNSGGIKEIAANCGLSEFMVEPGEHWEDQMYQVLKKVLSVPEEISEKLKKAKETASGVYSLESYTRLLDTLLYGK